MGNRNSANGYRTLADLLDGLADNGISVERVETGDIHEESDGLAVALEIEIPLDDGEPLEVPIEEGSAAVAPDATGAEGEPDSEAESTAEPASGDESGTGADRDSGDDESGTYQCDVTDCSAQFPTSAEREIHAETEHRQPDVPPHRNEAALEIAYEAFDSFPEMTEALGVDVTPQTVRRKAIDAGIHDPGGRTGADTGSSDDEAGAAEGDTGESGTESETTTSEGTQERSAEEAGEGPEARRVTDGAGGAVAGSAASTGEGSGVDTAPAAENRADDEGSAGDPPVDLPDEVGVGDLRTVAVEARTLREAAGELGLSRDRSRELLADLGLLELVHGRVAERLTPEEREERFDEWLTGARGESDPGNGS